MVSAPEHPVTLARPAPPVPRGRVVLRWPEPVWDGLFEQLCSETDLLKFERSAEGDLIITTLPGYSTPDAEMLLLGQLFPWAGQFGGFVLGPSAGYALTEMLLLSPCISWLSAEQEEALKLVEDDRAFPRICPFLVIEVRAKALSWDEHYGKMFDWMEHGCQVGLLVDWIDKRVALFRAGEDVQILERPSTLETDAERMPGLVLDFDAIWALTEE